MCSPNHDVSLQPLASSENINVRGTKDTRMTLATRSSLFSLSGLNCFSFCQSFNNPMRTTMRMATRIATPSTQSTGGTVVVLLQGKARLAAKSRCRQGKAMVNALRRCHKASEMRHHEGDAQRISWIAPSQENNHTPGTHLPSSHSAFPRTCCQ